MKMCNPYQKRLKSVDEKRDIICELGQIWLDQDVI